MVELLEIADPHEQAQHVKRVVTEELPQDSWASAMALLSFYGEAISGKHMSKQEAMVTINNAGRDQNQAGGDIVGGDKVGRDKNTAGGDLTLFWKENSDETTLTALVQELEKLVDQMKVDASTADELEKTADVAKAAEAAKKGDGPAVLKHLKNAGKWALTIAEKVGIPVAIAFLKQVGAAP